MARASLGIVWAISGGTLELVTQAATPRMMPRMRRVNRVADVIEPPNIEASRLTHRAYGAGATPAGARRWSRRLGLRYERCGQVGVLALDHRPNSGGRWLL